MDPRRERTGILTGSQSPELERHLSRFGVGAFEVSDTLVGITGGLRPARRPMLLSLAPVLRLRHRHHRHLDSPEGTDPRRVRSGLSTSFYRAGHFVAFALMLPLDDLDVRILREVNCPDCPQWNVRESFTAIGRRVGVDEETVRLRVLRLRDRGVLPALRIAINPRLLDLEEMGLDLDVPDVAAKTAVLSRLRFLPGITQVADFQGPGVLAVLWHDGADTVAWFRKQIDPVGAWTLRGSWTTPFPDPTIKMRSVDWRILASMRDDARKDLRTVAAAARTTVRTVYRRLSAMTEGKAAFVVGMPNPGRVVGLLCNYLVYCPDSAGKRAADTVVLREFTRIGTFDTGPEQYSIFGIVCENLSRAEETLAQLRSLYGVVTVRLAIVREIFSVDEWLDRRLREQVPPSPRPSRSAPD